MYSPEIGDRTAENIADLQLDTAIGDVGGPEIGDRIPENIADLQLDTAIV